MNGLILEILNKNISNIVSFLSLKDIGSLKLASKSTSKLISKKLIKKRIKNWKLPQSDRISFWSKYMNLKRIENEIRLKFKVKQKSYSLELLEKIENHLKNDNEELSKINQEIKRDLNRTFHTGDSLSESWQNSLGEVLNLVSFIRPKVEYVQGMNFIAGSLMNIFNNVEKSVEVLIGWIDNYNLYRLYQKGLPDYFLRKFQLEYFVKLYITDIFYFFKRNQGVADILFSKWVICLFSSYLNQTTLYLVWDLFIIDKWKSIIKLCLVFLLELKDRLLELDAELFSEFLLEIQFNQHLDLDRILRSYNSIKVSNKKLKELEEEFYRDQLIKKLEDNYAVWDEDQINFKNSYIYEKDRLDKITKKDILVHQENIQNASILFREKRTEFKNQVKICNQIKEDIDKNQIEIDQFETIIDMLNKKKEVIESVKNVERIKYSSDLEWKPKINHAFDHNKEVIDIELSKITIIYNKSIAKLNLEEVQLETNFQKVNEILSQVSKLKSDVKNTKSILEGYLKMCEMKHEGIFNDFLEKMKNSSRFKNSYTF